MSARERAAADAGITLIEVIVYVLLCSLILIAVPMMLVTSLTTQRDVASVNDATSRGQGMGSVIERAMRNAAAFAVSTDGTQLRVRTSLGGSLVCQAFLLTNGQARLAQSGSALPTDPTTWTDWEDDIMRDGTTPYFAVAGSKVTYAFRIATESAPIRIAGEASARTAATGVTAPCW